MPRQQRVQYQLHKPPMTRGVIILAALLVGSWLSTVLIAPWRAIVEGHLMIDGGTLPALELWAPLTYALFPRDFLMIVFDVLMLYFFGAELESRWGAKRWWGTIAGAAVAGGVLGALVAWPVGTARLIGGFAAPVMALVAAYCWGMWSQRVNLFFIELTGKSMLALFVGLDLLFALLSLDPTFFAVRLGGLGVGLLSAAGLSNLRKRYHYWRVRRNMRVVARTPEDDGGGVKRKRDDGTWIN